MKAILILLLMFVITGCDGQMSDETVNQSLSDTDLSGTWRYIKESKSYNTSSNEYLYSDFLEYTYIIDDNGVSVNYQSCWRYGDYLISAVKTDEYLYLDINSTGFSLEPDGDLSRTAVNDDPYNPVNEIRVTETLSKLSSSVQLDSGKFVLNGAITNNEDNHVCLFKSYNSLNSHESIEVVVPFDNSTLSLYFRTTSQLTPDTYQYEQHVSTELYSFNIMSNSNTFFSQIGTNNLSPSQATLIITQSTADTYSGTFSFVGIDDQSYSGEFVIDPAY